MSGILAGIIETGRLRRRKGDRFESTVIDTVTGAQGFCDGGMTLGQKTNITARLGKPVKFEVG